MNALSFLIATATIFILGFGLYILRLNPKLKLYRLFFLLCTATFLAAFSTNIMYCAENKDILLFWSKIEIIGCVLFFVLNLHFIILFTNKKIKNWQISTLYLPALIILYLNYTSHPLFSDFVKYGSLWKFIPPNNITLLLFIIYSISYTGISMILVYVWGIQSKLQKEKLQSKIIITVALIIWPIFLTTDFILPQFDFYKLLPLGPMGRVTYIIAIWYALVRYRFMIFEPSNAADEIISNIQEMVFFVNQEFRIITANKMCNEIFFLGPSECKNIYLFDFVKKTNEIKEKLNMIINGELQNYNCRLQYQTDSRNISADTYCSRVVDKFGDLSGILIISRENKEAKQFQRIYNLSDRQMEIIELSMSGLSNIEISKRLKISKRTIETHLCNIYNKIGINNKIELYNLTKDFNIFVP